jgi:ureidoacrylate peracid hydrolase
MNARTIDAKANDGLSAWIASSRTAVLIIDMQVDFASPDGALGGMVDFSTVGPALAAAERLADAARAADVPVVFVGLKTDPATDSQAWRERMRRMGGDPESDSGLCRAATVGVEFVGPKPHPGDPIVFKARYSGFHKTDLDAVLKGLGVDTLVVCGLTTECCIDCTVRDAFHLDYHVFIAADACAAYELDFHGPALKAMEANCAILTDVAAVSGAWIHSGAEVARG